MTLPLHPSQWHLHYWTADASVWPSLQSVESYQQDHGDDTSRCVVSFDIVSAVHPVALSRQYVVIVAVDELLQGLLRLPNPYLCSEILMQGVPCKGHIQIEHREHISDTDKAELVWEAVRVYGQACGIGIVPESVAVIDSSCTLRTSMRLVFQGHWYESNHDHLLQVITRFRSLLPLRSPLHNVVDFDAYSVDRAVRLPGAHEFDCTTLQGTRQGLPWKHASYQATRFTASDYVVSFLPPALRQAWPKVSVPADAVVPSSLRQIPLSVAIQHLNAPPQPPLPPAVPSDAAAPTIPNEAHAEPSAAPPSAVQQQESASVELGAGLPPLALEAQGLRLLFDSVSAQQPSQSAHPSDLCLTVEGFIWNNGGNGLWFRAFIAHTVGVPADSAAAQLARKLQEWLYLVSAQSETVRQQIMRCLGGQTQYLGWTSIHELKRYLDGTYELVNTYEHWQTFLQCALQHLDTMLCFLEDTKMIAVYTRKVDDKTGLEAGLWQETSKADFTKLFVQLQYCPFELQGRSTRRRAQTVRAKRASALSDEWLKWDGRCTRQRAGLFPTLAETQPLARTVLNKWRGMAITRERALYECAREADASQWALHTFLSVVVCGLCRRRNGQSENEDRRSHIKFNLLLDVMAHIVQYPSVPLGFVFLIISHQGTGKSMLVDMLNAILGPQYCFIDSDPDKHVGKYNGHYRDKLLIGWPEMAVSEKQLKVFKERVTSRSINLREMRRSLDVGLNDHSSMLASANYDAQPPLPPSEFAPGARRCQLFLCENDRNHKTGAQLLSPEQLVQLYRFLPMALAPFLYDRQIETLTVGALREDCNDAIEWYRQSFPCCRWFNQAFAAPVGADDIGLTPATDGDAGYELDELQDCFGCWCDNSSLRCADLSDKDMDTIATAFNLPKEWGRKRSETGSKAKRTYCMPAASVLKERGVNVRNEQPQGGSSARRTFMMNDLAQATRGLSQLRFR